MTDFPPAQKTKKKGLNISTGYDSVSLKSTVIVGHRHVHVGKYRKLNKQVFLEDVTIPYDKDLVKENTE